MAGLPIAHLHRRLRTTASRGNAPGSRGEGDGYGGGDVDAVHAEDMCGDRLDDGRLRMYYAACDASRRLAGRERDQRVRQGHSGVDSMIEVVESHVVYENPKPMLRSRHGYFSGVRPSCRRASWSGSW